MYFACCYADLRTDLICYNSWYRKAARTAREASLFCCKVAPLAPDTARGAAADNFRHFGESPAGDRRQQYGEALPCRDPVRAHAVCCDVSHLFGGENRCGQGESAASACVTAAAVALASVGVLLTMEQNGLFDSDEVPPELYDEEFRATVYHDALPLYLSDLGVADENVRWSCLSWEMSSPFASQRGGWQDDVLAAFDDPEHPETARGNPTWIHYSVSDVPLHRGLAAVLPLS